jgi:hypothetical protein
MDAARNHCYPLSRSRPVELITPLGDSNYSVVSQGAGPHLFLVASPCYTGSDPTNVGRAVGLRQNTQVALFSPAVGSRV